jgi:purine-binding chemotaxis protein CheW
MHTDTTAPTPSARASAGEFVTFRLGAEEYGIDILKVQEIRSYEPPTRIANAPDFVKGVINLRGVIVPIVDLRLKFGLDDAGFDALTVVIILNVARRVVGVVVDSVSDVLDIGADQIKPPPAFGATLEASYISGLGTVTSGDAQRMLILTDIEQLLSSTDLGIVGSAPALH